MGNIVPFPKSATPEAPPSPGDRANLRPLTAPDRVHACLRRRIEATMERRRETALMADDDFAFAIWNRERDRGDKLRRALITWLSRS